MIRPAFSSSEASDASFEHDTRSARDAEREPARRPHRSTPADANERGALITGRAFTRPIGGES